MVPTLAGVQMFISPIGIANSAPTPVTMNDPTIEFAMPLPCSPTGFGMFRKKSRLSEVMPWLTT